MTKSLNSNHLHNETPPPLTPFRLGDIDVLPEQNSLVCDEKRVIIEPRVMAVLCLLAEESGNVVTRDTLIARIWGTEHGGDDSINQAISVLRKALTEVNGPDEYIKTIPKRGYRLRTTVVPLVETKPEPDKPSVDKSTSNGSHVWILTGIAIAMMAFWLNGKTAHNNALPAPSPSIAVLPFDTISTALGDEVANVHDALLTSLQKIKSLRVISKNSTLRYKDSSLRIPEIASELGVTWIVEGTLVREGNNIRINATLIDGRTDSTAWSQQYERPLDTNSVYEIQASIAKNIARELSSMIAPDSVIIDRSPPTQNMAAYRLYLLGKHRVEERSGESLEDGVAKLREAIELDPQFAAAYAELAMAYSLQSHYANLTRTELLDVAMPLAQRAVGLAPDLAEAHTALADMRALTGDIKGAEESYQLAIRLNPNYPRARMWYAVELMSDGRVAEALEEHRAARELDPLSIILSLNVAQDLFYLGRIEEALAEYEYALELDPEYAGTYAHIANIYRLALAQHDQAAKWLIEANTIAPEHTEFPSQLATIYLELQEPGLAHAWAKCGMQIGPTRYWPNRAAMLVALHNSNTEGIIQHASLIHERQPEALLPLIALRDIYIARGDINSARSLLTLSRPDMMSDTPQVTEYDYAAALALAYYFRTTGELARADILLQLAQPFIENHQRNLELGASLVDIEYLSMTGQIDQAFATLNEAIDNKWRRNWWRLSQNKHLEAMQADPRFDDILTTLQQRMSTVNASAPKQTPPSNCGE